MGRPATQACETLPPLELEPALAALPPIWPDAGLRQHIRAQLEESRACIVVIDDDPTGTQTVHDVPVLTTWDLDTLRRELRSGAPVIYLLSNSRALPPARAVALAQDMGANLRRAASDAGRAVEVISRSDSTLRGHFPAETDALAGALGLQPDAVLIVPYFREGGRYTIGDVHYVQQADRLVPAAQTPFASDRVFGYRHSNLRRWVEEKSGGRWPADDVGTLPLSVIRQAGPAGVLPVLLQAQGGRPLVVNAAADRDLEVVVAALAEASARGKRFLCRTAASFAKVRGGITDRPVLRPSDLPSAPAGVGGGLVVVGSHVPLSSRQLACLLSEPAWAPVELDVSALVDPALRPARLREAGLALRAALAAGQETVLFTSRTPVAGSDAAATLAIEQSVSAAIVRLIGGLEVRPRYLIAKGGITSSDIATQALGVRRAVVLGQIAPGVPVWQLGEESRYPGLPYVIFPGNVGQDETLAAVARRLREGL